MRTVSTAISSGYSSNYTPFLLVKVEGSGGNTYYWTTQSKNASSGNTMTLKETSGGGSLSYDSGMIATEILEGGQKRSITGIGQIAQQVDVYGGGGIGSVGDLRITILNQERFDQTIVTAAVNIENRPVTVFLGFIPTGVSPSVVIADDMLKLWAGVVEHLNDYSYGEFFLHCVDGSFQKHKEIPTTIINENDYPDAPKENFGKPIPMLYGDFEEADEELARDYMRLAPAPAVKTNDAKNYFHFADHEIHTVGNLYFWSDGNNVYGKIETAATSSNTAGGCYIYWSGSVIDIVVSFTIQPKNAPAVATGIGDPENAVDDDAASVATYTSGAATDILYSLRLEEDGILTKSGTGGSVIQADIILRFGNMIGSGTDQIEWVNSVRTQLVDYSDADANTRKVAAMDENQEITWDIFSGSFFGLDQLSALSTVQIQNIAVRFYIKVARFLYFKDRGIGRRRI